MGRVRIGQAPIGHMPGFRGPYPGHMPKSGFRGPYGACAENITQTEIDISRNYSTLHLRKTKYFNVACVQARTTLEINEKILSQGSNLEPNRIIFGNQRIISQWSLLEGCQA